MNTGYILGLSRGHNAGACLLKDGKIVFAIEEERLSRHKYDGGPFSAMMKVKEYTDKVDAIIVAHTQTMDSTSGKIDYTGDNVYVGMARKLNLIERKTDVWNHPQVFDLSIQHHKTHAACAFYRSGFEDAVAVIVDGAGTCVQGTVHTENIVAWEVESIIDCSYPANFKTLYKHYGCKEPIPTSVDKNAPGSQLGEEGHYVQIISGNAGITKVYEAVTDYCGFQAIEAGKTMGLFPYGKENDKIPSLFQKDTLFPLSNRNLIVPTYPNGAVVNATMYEDLISNGTGRDELSTMQNRRDLAFACQKQTQEQVLNLILKACEMSNKKKVVLCGGYALNCVANYFYLDELNKRGIELYVEPISNDAGTALGAAFMFYYSHTGSTEPQEQTVYLGPTYNYSDKEINDLCNAYNASIKDASNDDIVDLLLEKNIVAIFQGQSENGPRALGNRSLLFNPTYEDGKDFVNLIKRREYFRPFAGSILEEDAHEWFDLKGMSSSPTMMYAVNCKEGIEEKIPSIIHVDGTCRIQTVNKEQNLNYYDLIKTFKSRTGIPIIFNTSFNLGGEPLVETLEDALWTLQQSKIEYLYLPEYNKLITISNWEII